MILTAHNEVRYAEAAAVSFETLGLNGESLAPLISPENPPEQLRLDLLEDFRDAFLNSGGTDTCLEGIRSNIRCIDDKTFEDALDVLAANLESSELPILLIHDGDERGSRVWIADKLATRSPDRFSTISVDEIADLGSLKGYDLVVADDLRIFGEQTGNIVKKLTEMGVEQSAISEAYIAATNLIRLPGTRKIRVFEVPTLDELNLSRQLPKVTWSNGDYILTFLYYKVADRFYPNLKRSDTVLKHGDRYTWLIDDLTVPPPYDTDRFDPGTGWGRRASERPSS